MSSQQWVGECLHGCPEPPPGAAGEACRQFLATFHDEYCRALPVDPRTGMIVRPVSGRDDQDALFGAIELTYRKHPDVWNDDEIRNMVRCNLIANGTNHILKGYTIAAASLAMSIGMLENYVMGAGLAGIDLAGSPEEYVMKVKDALEGCERSLAKFYSKRTPCSCLDEKCSELKKEPKTGMCDHCKQRTLLDTLSICSRCKTRQYCSRECQMAAWPGHKDECKEWARKLKPAK